MEDIRDARVDVNSVSDIDNRYTDNSENIFKNNKSIFKTWFGVLSCKLCDDINDAVDGVVDDIECELKTQRKSLDLEDVENKNKLPFNLPDIAISLDIFKNKKEYYFELRKQAISFFRSKALLDLKRDDRYVVMLVKLLDELDNTINLLSNKVDDIEEVISNELTIAVKRKILELKEVRKNVEKEIEHVVEKIAPNLSSILGGVLTARLIEKAGSLKRLAEMPSSTIQIIGAEKSLYKAISRIKKGKKAKIPKHGIIFQHPYIKSLPKKKRGKMSRFMAAKIAIAARIDYFSGELMQPQKLQQLQLSSQIRKKYEELRRLG